MARRRAVWTPGRDRAAERHLAPQGEARDARRHHVAVLGGGVAGLAAATALAERDVAVTLIEKHDQLGGRVRAWPVEHVDGPATMSRGFHAFFRQYYNLRALLRRADPGLQRLTPVEDYPLVSADGFEDSFARVLRHPPLNLASFVVRSDTFTLRDLLHVDVPSALEMLDVDFPQTFSDHDGESAAQYLDRLRFPVAARHLALEVFARSFFAHPEDFAAGELIAMFHAYFLGSSEGLLFDVPDDDYDTALWAPLRRYLERAGVDVRAGTSVHGVQLHDDGVVISTAGGDVLADAVVVATDLATTQQLLAGLDDPAVDPAWREQVAGLPTAPPFAVWRAWLDRPAAAERAAFLGTAGFGVVDNISVLERFERGADEWAGRTGGSVVELHAYALRAGDDEAAVRAQMRATLHHLYPELRGARAVAEEYLLSADCPLVGTGPWLERPAVNTPDPRIVLAGDWVRCAFPVALMERAATTGLLAANQLLGGWQVRGHDVWTVPTRARSWLGAASALAARSRSAARNQPTSPLRTRYRRSA